MNRAERRKVKRRGITVEQWEEFSREYYCATWIYVTANSVDAYRRWKGPPVPDTEWDEFMKSRLECGCDKDLGCICYTRR